MARAALDLSLSVGGGSVHFMTLEDIKVEVRLCLESENGLIAVIAQLRESQDLTEFLTLTERAKLLLQTKLKAQSEYFEVVYTWSSGD